MESFKSPGYELSSRLKSYIDSGWNIKRVFTPEGNNYEIITPLEGHWIPINPQDENRHLSNRLGLPEDCEPTTVERAGIIARAILAHESERLN